jgi:hypothetical protein
MTTTRNIRACVLLAALAASGLAQAGPGKKLYCWTDAGGHKVCGDAVPPDAIERGHTEISAKSGLQTGQVARVLTAEERAAAAAAADQAQADAEAEAARQRRDLAMIESYGTEADLRRAYGERISLLESSIKASALGVSNLRLSLTSLLSQASDLELANKPVAPVLLANVRNQHMELEKQQRILASQEHDRAALDGEFTDAVQRYRTLKQAQGAPAGEMPAQTPLAAPPTGG